MAADTTDVETLRERLRAADVALSEGTVAGYLQVGTALNLDANAVGLGLANASSEPERFPGLVSDGTTGRTTGVLFEDGTVAAVDARSATTAETALEGTVANLRELGLLDGEAGDVDVAAPVDTVPLPVASGQ